MTLSDISGARRGRRAIAAIFLVNGFILGSWAPQIPLVLTRLSISEFTLGLMILGFGLGALIVMPVCGWLISHWGSRRVTAALALAGSVGLLLVLLAPGVASASAALVMFGGLIGGTDVAMNANAVEVEKRLGRAVMSSSHGFWSLGGFVGGGTGGLIIERFGYLAHGWIVAFVSLAVVSVAVRYLVSEERPESHAREPFTLPRRPSVYLIGVVALFSMIPEGAVLDWAALYLRQELGAGIATAGLAFAAFSGAMALMRFLGDGIRDRFGAVATLRASSLIAAAGMLAGGLAPTPWVAIAAFAVAGLGIANTVPIAFSAAGNQPGLSSANGMAIVTTMGYAGILLAPSVVGFVAERTGFAPVYLGVAALLALVAAMAPLARGADFTPRA